MRPIFTMLTLTCSMILPAFAGVTTVGESLTIETATAIADILADPAAFHGETVRVEGEVAGVCQKMGCWMDITDEAGNEIKIKVDDGVLVFPKDAGGGQAIVQGKVSMREVERDAYVEWFSHLAEDKGEQFDPESIGEAPYRLVQIEGHGAEVTTAD